MTKNPTKSELQNELMLDSLMEDIQKIIKPPDDEKSSFKKATTHSYRKVGSRHNLDYCHACNESGVLICCDECPASFHYQCHDPPLQPEDIPEGEWLCNTCRMTKKLNQPGPSELIAKSELLSSRPQTPSGDSIDKSLRIGRKRSGSRKSSNSSESSDKTKVQSTLKKIAEEAGEKDEKMEEDQKEEVAAEPPKKATPLDDLIRAATLLNPKQFELPREMNVTFQFPGCERVDGSRNGRRIGRMRKPYEKDSQGLVPLPAKLCNECHKSCKLAPLIQCDYCPLLYHQDCLDPPLTALPTTLWMCPKHPQHFMDNHFLKSASSIERVKLWNKLDTKIDHELVKLQFFRKVHNKNPPFRVKGKPKPKNQIEIPEYVEYHYKNPPKLLPSHKTIMRLDTLRQRGTVNLDFLKRTVSDEIDEELCAIKTARKKLRNMVADINNIEQLFDSGEEEDDDVVMVSEEKGDAEKEVKKETNEAKENPGTSSDPTEVEIKNEEISTGKQKESTKPVAKPPPTKGSKKEYPKEPLVKDITADVANTSDEIKLEDKSDTINLMCDESMESEKTCSIKMEDIESDDDTPAMEAELQNMDEKTIRLLAFQRIQQILNEHPDLIKNYQDKNVASKTVRDIARKEFPKKPIPLPSQLLTKEDIDKITRTLSTNETLDTEQENKKRLQTQKYYDLRQKPFNQRTDEEKAHTIALSLEKPIQQSKIRARAVFTPVNDYLSGDVWFTAAPDIRKSVQMRYRSFQIGNGPGADLNLSAYGKCAFVSPKHAIVFYDEITKQFELLNYSEFGTEVNGQLFTCDFTEFQNQLTESPTSQTKEKRVAVQSKIKNMIDAKKKIRENMDKPPDVVMAAPEPSICDCQGRAPLIAGWEGTALLYHGYLIKFGCLSFVFSAADYDSGNED